MTVATLCGVRSTGRVGRLMIAAILGTDAEVRHVCGWGGTAEKSAGHSAPFVPVGQRSRIKVTYDWQNLVFAVNDVTVTLPCQERAFFNPATIGGPNNPSPGLGIGADVQYFPGKLRRLRIAHRAENE